MKNNIPKAPKEIQSTTIKFPVDLHKVLKIKATQNGTTMQEFIVSILKKQVM
jgi:predicted DNA binding CopG/RHH family protein